MVLKSVLVVFDEKIAVGTEGAKDKILVELKVPGPERIWYVADAFRHGFTLDEVFAATNIDRWFLIQIPRHHSV